MKHEVCCELQLDLTVSEIVMVYCKGTQIHVKTALQGFKVQAVSLLLPF